MTPSNKELNEESKNAIRSALDKILTSFGFADGAALPGILAGAGIEKYKDFAVSLRDFFEKYFADEYRIELNYKVGEKYHPMVLLKSSAEAVGVAEKGAAPIAVKSEKNKLECEASWRKLEETPQMGVPKNDEERAERIRLLKERIAELFEENGGATIAQLVLPWIKKYAIKYDEYGAAGLAGFLKHCLLPEYSYRVKGEIGGKKFSQVVLPATEADLNWPRKMSDDERRKLLALVRENLDADNTMELPILTPLLRDNCYGEISDYSDSARQFVEQFLEPEIVVCSVVNGNNIQKIGLPVAQTEEAQNVSVRQDETVRDGLDGMKRISADLRRALEAKINEKFRDAAYISAAEFVAILAELGIADYHEYAQTMHDFVRYNLYPVAAYSENAYAPNGEVVDVAIVPGRRRLLTVGGLRALKEQLLSIVDTSEYFLEAQLPRMVKRGFVDLSRYCTDWHYEEFVKRFLGPELIHYAKYWANRENGVAMRNVIARVEDAEIQRRRAERFDAMDEAGAPTGFDASKQSIVIEPTTDAMLDAYGIMSSARRSRTLGALMMETTTEELEKVRSILRPREQRFISRIDNSTHNNMNLSINVGQITSTIGAIAGGGMSGERLLGEFNKMPRLGDFGEKLELAEGAVIEGETEERVSEKSDKMVKSYQEAVIEGGDKLGKFVIWDTLGIERRDYLRLTEALNANDAVYSMDLYFAARIDSVFEILSEDKTISDEEKDYSPAAIMYTKLVERLLKDIHAPLYAERIPNESTRIEINKKPCVFGDYENYGEELSRRFTLGTFLMPIRNASERRMQVMANSDNVRKYGPWYDHANRLSMTKNVRDKVAHGDKFNRVSADMLNELKMMLFREGGLLAILDLADR